MKSKKALRTIGETSDLLGVADHVIRFWESNFTNLKPVKMNGRRYYSLDNIKLLKQIQDLLHQQNYSIKDAVAYFKSNQHPLLKIKAKLLKARDRLYAKLTIY